MKKQINWVVVVALIMVAVSTLTFGWKINENKDQYVENSNIETTLRNNMNKFSGEFTIRNTKNIANLNNSRDYIMNQFKKCGYEIKVQQFDNEGVNVSNIIAIKKGSRQSSGTIVVGAPYFSGNRPSVDASDTGISAILTIADQMKNLSCTYDIEFVAFANSEKPYTSSENIGSKIYVNSIKDKQSNIKGAVILDCIGYYTNTILTQRYPFMGVGYPNKGNFLAAMGDSNSKSFNDDFVAKFKKKSSFPIVQTNSNKILGASKEDNYSFWQAKIPAVLLTDTGIYRYEDLYTKRDTKDKLNYKAMSEIINNITSSLSNY
ncbi:M28 family peptidase [Inconstantimicrobium mannanitabidum]|uniref:Uncharacterized protein n=1 Tax=Inconstantimicrobium mannanitabidum TaxID=1604901 RepID=A0ACB5R7C3_9CLOT|nr:M28 family peptidase [Clostridium sp. TW13]GKX65088.1 hypothetical protein rsdtw13_03460 [Clostridium sp. TW13]